MAYIPDPTDSTQPTDAILAETAQAEFRALKGYLQAYIAAVGGVGSFLSGFKNKIINGEMLLDQRKAGAATTVGAGSLYILDRYQVISSVANKLTFQQISAGAPTGFKSFLQVSVNAQYAAGAAESFYLQQKIEGINVIDFAFGAVGALTVVTSAYIKGSVPGVYPIALSNGALDRTYVGTVAVTANWQRLSITVPGDLAGAWLTDTGIGLRVIFDLGSGVNFNAPALNAWQAGAYLRSAGNVSFVNQVNGSTLSITGLQTEANVMSPFEHRFPALDEFLAFRYTKIFNSDGIAGMRFGSGVPYAVNGAIITHPLPARMRAIPTVTMSAFADWNVTQGTAADVVSVLASGQTSRDNLGLQLTTGGGVLPLVNGSACLVSNNINARLVCDAEL